MIKAKKIISLLIAAYMLIFSVSATVYDIEDENDESLVPIGDFIPSRVMITDYFVEGGGFVAGEIRKVTYIVKNMSNVSNVTSVLLIGWIDTVTPVEFTGTNQDYIEIIPPKEEVEFVFEYYTRNVDMTAISNVSAGFTIYYCDDALGGSERTNSVSVKLPVLHGTRSMIDEEYMKWATPSVSRLDRLMSSKLMQALYAACFVWCSIWILLLMLFKLGILKRKF